MSLTFEPLGSQNNTIVGFRYTPNAADIFDETTTGDMQVHFNNLIDWLILNYMILRQITIKYIAFVCRVFFVRRVLVQMLH